jgi:hypothetical protein
MKQAGNIGKARKKSVCRIDPSYEHFRHCFVHRVDADVPVFREGILVRFSVYTIVSYLLSLTLAQAPWQK